jgi:hypothetical protein
LVIALGKKSKRLNKQTMVEFEIEGDKFNHVFLVAQQLTVPVILGADFLNENKIILNFEERSLQAEREGIVVKYKFNKDEGQGIADSNRRDSGDDSDYGGAYANHTLVLDSGSQSNPQVNNPAVTCGCSRSQKGTDAEEDIMEEEPQFLNVFCNDCNRDCSNDCSDREIIVNECGQYDPARIEYARHIDIDKGERRDVRSNSVPRAKPTERRNFSSEDLSEIIEAQGNLSRMQRNQLRNVLAKYVDHFTSRPGLCKTFCYGFQVNSQATIKSQSRQITFSLRAAVREEINQMVRDGIIEVSCSPHVNPLVIVSRDGKTTQDLFGCQKDK